MRPLRSALLLLLALGACGDPLSITLRVAPPMEADRVRVWAFDGDRCPSALEARNGAGATALLYDARVERGEPLPPLPDLPTEGVVFVAFARSDGCRPEGFACEVLDAPRATIDLVLEPTSVEGPWCGPEDACVANDCVPVAGLGVPLLRTPAAGARTRGRPTFRWTEVEGARGYEIEATSEAGCGPFAPDECAFRAPAVQVRLDDPSHRPTGALAPRAEVPVRASYLWRVRACDATACGPWSRPSYFHVGAVAGDLDGDGEADLVVAESLLDRGESERAGEVHVRSRAGGLQPLGVPPHPAGLAGYRLSSAGDFNGDGYADLVVPITGHEDGVGPDAGVVLVYPGGPESVETPVRFASPSPQPDAFFGWDVSLAADFDGDGYDDLAVAADEHDGETMNEGLVVVFYGDATMSGARSQVFAHPMPVEEARQGAVAAGDFDADGYPDLVVGSYLNRLREGAPLTGVVYVYPGGPEGIATTPEVQLAPRAAEAGNARFGAFLATGDLNGDGASDLAVGAHEYAGGEGRAYFFQGRYDDGLRNEPDQDLPSPAPAERGVFGVALGFVPRAEGGDELWIGAPGNEVVGRVYRYEDDGGGLPRLADALAPPAGTRCERMDATPNLCFGLALGALDEGDARPTLVVGAPFAMAGDVRAAGRVYLFRPDPSGAYPGSPSSVLDPVPATEGAAFGLVPRIE